MFAIKNTFGTSIFSVLNVWVILVMKGAGPQKKTYTVGRNTFGKM